MTMADTTSTREEILNATAHLLVTRGYRGTSTRDIAAAVNIRQPSLFHHFESKRAIFAELLEADMMPAATRLRYLADLDGPAAPRLTAHIIADYRVLANTRYDVRGIYTNELLDDPDFVEYREHFARFSDDIARIVRQGVGSAEFRDVHPEHAQHAIAGLFYAAIWRNSQSADPTLDWGEASAEMVLRGLLRRPSGYPKIRKAADRVLAAMPAEIVAA
jgi:AcrR family transcriptional regulator